MRNKKHIEIRVPNLFRWNILTQTQKYIPRPVPGWTFGAVLSVTYSTDRLNHEGRLTGECYQHFLQEDLCLWKSGGRRGSSKMEHPLILVTLPFSIDSFQTVG
jgi:hypothetical protein